MAQTHDLGRFYTSSMNYLHRKAAPLLVERGWTNEIERPYRRGKCLVLRIPFTLKGLVFGLWGRPGNEEDRLGAAIGLREIGYVNYADDNLA
jgi:hypothetical protein